MLKKVTAFILLLAFFAMTFSQVIILTSFVVNRNYIAKYLCENRSRPVMRCGGKCCLAKKLRNEQKKDQENAERKSENKLDTITTDYFSSPEESVSIVAIQHVARYRESPAQDFRARFFHPPQGSLSA